MTYRVHKTTSQVGIRPENVVSHKRMWWSPKRIPEIMSLTIIKLKTITTTFTPRAASTP